MLRNLSEQHVSILESFLNDHVTLNLGVMMLKKNSFNYILKYILILN